MVPKNPKKLGGARVERQRKQASITRRLRLTVRMVRMVFTWLWDSHTDFCEFSLTSQTHDSMIFTPVQALLGREKFLS